MIFKTSTYYKIRHLKKKIKVVQGGQGAGKTFAICQILIEDLLKEKQVTTIVADTYDNLKDGAIKDCEYIFECSDGVLDWNKCYNKSSHEITLPNGSKIQFRYISDNKPMAGKSKRRDKLYINEANKIGWEAASTYIGRTHGDIYLDFNPDQEFWGHTELPKLKDANGDSLSEFIIVTYIDNELLPQSEIDYIESRRDNIEWFRVYGLGQTGYYSERRIYNYDFFDQIPTDARRLPSGMDFGISPDPTILIDVYLKNTNLYVIERFCMNNLMPEKIKGAERMAIVDMLEQVKHPRGQKIIADSAGATEIKDIRKHFYEIKGVKKSPGSVINGINKLRGFNIFISRDSVNIKKGIEGFYWQLDKNGKIIPEPDGHEPDGLAALRYVIMEYNRGQ